MQLAVEVEELVELEVERMLGCAQVVCPSAFPIGRSYEVVEVESQVDSCLV